MAEQAGVSRSNGHKGGQCCDGKGTQYILSHFVPPLLKTGTDFQVDILRLLLPTFTADSASGGTVQPTLSGGYLCVWQLSNSYDEKQEQRD